MTLTPQDFIAKWKSVELKERSASQSHFNDLCRLLDIDEPTTADHNGEWFTFEKGASKTSGGKGWADVWRKDCFAWEYKGKRKNLKAAFDQLLRYSVALDHPPLLIVSDMDQILIHTNWTNTVQEIYTLTLDDLLDGGKRDLLKNAFVDPERLKPEKTRQVLTEDAAKKFSSLAQRLRDRGHDAQTVAHFVNRLVFCLFAEDVVLLPNKMFQRVLEHSLSAPEEFQENAELLFAAMASKEIGKVGLEKVEWFNGGLFDDKSALPLEKADVKDLLDAAKLDWSDIDPSILGTLFERGLDPAKRSQLGAHYTDRDKIMQIVEPVIIRPLLAEWAKIKGNIEDLLDKAPKETKERLLRGKELAARTRALNAAEALQGRFLERLRAFRVLDPACGSGNFLYLSLLALKDLEHRVNLEAEALGLPPAFPTVGPECVKGIELNPYAAELARVSVWIGEIQWMRRNGYEASKNPILRSLGTIECRDAVLKQDGSRAEWPIVDAIVGNPPFLGDRRMISALGEEYVNALRGAYEDVIPGRSDLVCYWFAQAVGQLSSGQAHRVGLVATNSISGGNNLPTLSLVKSESEIWEAWRDEPWVVDGAAVRVSLVMFGEPPSEIRVLDGNEVSAIQPNLRTGVDLSAAKTLKENNRISFIGTQKNGPFDIPGETARGWLSMPTNPNGLKNSEVVMPWTNGASIVRRDSDTWIIHFGSKMSEHDASLFEAPFEHVVENVRPTRVNLRRQWHRTKWWLHGDPRPAMTESLESLDRFIVTPRVAKHRIFVWRNRRVLPDSAVVAIARDDDTAFGVLHSCFHERWALRMGTYLGVGNDPRYTPSTTFETFPFPEGLTPDIPAAGYANNLHAQSIAAAATRLNVLRENWLNPPDLVNRTPEVIPGFPDRIQPKDEAAAKELKKRTLTNLYNASPTWLVHAHRTLDEAVAEAYGWGDDWRSGILTDDEILARLFKINQERAAKQSN